MTIQSLWTGPIAAGKDGTRLSFWRRVVAAIAEGRQKKAEAIVKEYLQRHAENQDRNKDRLRPQSRHGIRSISPLQGASTRPCQIRGRIRSTRNRARRLCQLRSYGVHRRGERLARILRRRRHPSSIAPAYCNRGMNLSVSAPLTAQSLSTTATSLRIPEQNLHRGCRQPAFIAFANARSRHARQTRYRGRIYSGLGRREADFPRRSDRCSRRPLHASGSVDVFQIHQTVGTLPLQNVHDMSFVFPSPAA